MNNTYKVDPTAGVTITSRSGTWFRSGSEADALAARNNSWISVDIGGCKKLTLGDVTGETIAFDLKGCENAAAQGLMVGWLLANEASIGFGIRKFKGKKRLGAFFPTVFAAMQFKALVEQGKISAGVQFI